MVVSTASREEEVGDEYIYKGWVFAVTGTSPYLPGLIEAPQFVRQPSFNVDSSTGLVTAANVSLTCNVTQPPYFPPATIT